MTSVGVMASASGVSGFHPCGDVLAYYDDMDDLSNWSLLGSTPSLVPGRVGTAAFLSIGGGNGLSRPFVGGEPFDTLTFGFAFRTDRLPSAGNNSSMAIPVSAGVQQFAVRIGNEITSGGIKIQHQGDGSTIANSVGGLIVPFVWYYLEVQARCHTTAGFVKVRLDGVEIINVTNVNTCTAGGTGVIDAFTFPGSATAGVTYDDVYISSGSDCVFKGDPNPLPPAVVTDVLLEPFNNYTSWTLGGSPTIVAGGRTGNGGQFTASSTTASFTIPGVNESDTVTIGFAWKASTFANANTNIAEFRSDAGATVHLLLRITSGGSIIVVRSPSTSLGGTSHGMTVGTFAYIEFQAMLADAGGSVRVRINGVDKINAPSVDTRNAGTKTVFDTVRILGTGSTTAVFDDLYITTGAGAPFKGDIAIP